MRFTYALPVLAMLAFVPPALAADDYVLMKVNGQDVSSGEAQRFWEGLFPPGQAPAFDSVKPDVREKILRGVLAEKLLLAEAQKQGLDKSDAVTKQVGDMKRKLVVRALLDQKTNDISDADLKKEYEAQIATLKDEKEVHARHILVNSEAEAKDVKKQIDGGKSFEDVAKNLSKDAGSAKNGGDLGYFTKDKMVPEFAAAAFNLKKGEVSDPVKSAFGWHIIKVEDVRKATPPSFAEMKDELKSHLQEKRLNDYVGGLVKNADVKVFDKSGKTIPFDKNASPQPVKAEPAPAEKSDSKDKDDKASKSTDKAGDKPADKKSDSKKSDDKKPDEKKASH